MITNYSTLKSAVSSWLHRTDLDSVIPDLIAMGEQRMNSDIDARDMETTVTLTTVANTSTVATPTDVVESVRMTLLTSPNRVLNYLAPEALKNQFANLAAGEPRGYTVLGSNFEFGPVPDGAYSLEYIYRQRIPALSDSNTTNWLITKWPYVYLYAALIASAPYLGQDQRIALWKQEYQDLVDKINSIDWYTGTSMRVRAI